MITRQLYWRRWSSGGLKKAQTDSWCWEQEEAGVTLKEWALCVRDFPEFNTDNFVLKTLCKFWRKALECLVPGISPLVFSTPRFSSSFRFNQTFQIGSKGVWDSFMLLVVQDTCIPKSISVGL